MCLSIYDEDDGPASVKDFFRLEGGVEEVDLPREVPDRELHERAVGDLVLHYLISALQEKSLVRRHLVEDDLLDRGFAAPNM